MQGFEETMKDTVGIELERETSQTSALTTTIQRRRSPFVKVSYLTRANEKKAIDCKYMGTLS